MQVTIERTTHALTTPLSTAYGEVAERTLFTVSLTSPDGVVGRGEAAPLEAYDGVPDDAVAEALERYADALADDRDRPGMRLLDACREVADLPQALAAIDLALWDAAGRRAGKPVAELLTDEPAASVGVNATIGAVDSAIAAAAAEEAVAAGYPCIKLKVGVGDDVARVTAVRAAAGPFVALRLDANGAWSVNEAIMAIASLSPAGLELVEEPVSGIEALRTVRERVPVRIAMDETAARPGALASAATDAVCLKISRAGGIGALSAQAALARALGAEVYLASSLDGPLGIAAAVHCAAALGVELPSGLATLGHLGLADERLAVHAGAIAVPRGPGLLG
jgi:L-alanine-DL-glutamate epimerase-like enolase superfamily enzyme